MALARLRKALGWRCRRFARRQGFAVMTVICAAVIAGSAAWTRQAGFRHASPEPTPFAASAAELWQQSLREAATPSPLPTREPVRWRCPVSGMTPLRGFDAERLLPSGLPGLWLVHDAVDLAAREGEEVAAMADGVVTGVTEQGFTGLCVVIDHGDGVEATYAGLSRSAELTAGDSVRAGQVVGYAGRAHGQGEACLHLRITVDGAAVDPLPMLSLP